MENHPIPQDVTGFQFKLIGDMTVRQFAYLAAGVILGWISLNSPAAAFIKLPLATLFFGIGISLAFIPLEGRPMDVMITHFIRALFTPNQYMYQKMGRALLVSIPTIKTYGVKPVSSKESAEKLQVYLEKLPKKPKNKLDEKELSFLASLSLSLPSLSSPKQSEKPKIITMEEEKKVLDKEDGKKFKPEGENKEALEKEALLLQKELETAKEQEKAQKAPEQTFVAHQKVLTLEEQLRAVIEQKQALEQQLLALQQKFAASTQQVYSPSTMQPHEKTQNVRKIAKGMGKSVGLPFVPDTPNVITGIIKDPRGNILPNILVEVRDKNGSPLRAFKTNPLGQFAASTPLANGTYTVTFEDPNGAHKFDTVELLATGVVMDPIEVISRDEREDLRRELFGNVA